MTEDDALADLLAFVLTARPERLTSASVGQMSAEERAALGRTANTVALLARQNEEELPSPALRARILETLRARSARPQRRALLICDMIVDHLTPGRTFEVPRARVIVPAVARRAEAARAAGMPVVHVVDRHADDDEELDEWGAHAMEGTDGAEIWPDLAPQEGDHVIAKTTYSAFVETELARLLEELAVDTLVLAGCATEVQLMATATDALQRGFEVEIPADTQAGTTAVAERVTMAVVSSLIPYVPARKALLARAQSAATFAPSGP